MDQIRDYADGTRTYVELMEITGRSYKMVTRGYRDVRDRGFPVAVKLARFDGKIELTKEDYILFRDRFNEGWTPHQIAKLKGEGWTAKKVEWYWRKLRVEYEPGRKHATWRQRADESY